MTKKPAVRWTHPLRNTDSRPFADRLTEVAQGGRTYVELSIYRRGNPDVEDVVRLDVEDARRLEAWVAEGNGRRSVRSFDSNRTHRRNGHNYRPRIYAQLVDSSNGTVESVYLHRWVLNMVDAPRTIRVRHLNDDGLDNRRCNLASGTAAQNSMDAIDNRLRALGTTSAAIEEELAAGHCCAVVADLLAVPVDVVRGVRRRAVRSGRRSFPHPGRRTKAEIQ
jgi:hypothetical protein